MGEYERLELQKDEIEQKKARKIVNEILIDLTDRKGLKHEWFAIDEDIQQEIIAKWVGIVKENL